MKMTTNAASGGGGSVPRVAQHETLHTLNVIMQQAALYATQSARQSTLTTGFGRYLQVLARKATLRLDTSMKRAICQRCDAVLLPGLTCSKRTQASRSADLLLRTRCFTCGMSTSIPCPASDHRRFKAASARKKATAAKMEGHQLAAKVQRFNDILSSSDSSAAVELKTTAVRSQRARRKIARRKAGQRLDQNGGPSRRPNERRKRSVQRLRSSSREDADGTIRSRRFETSTLPLQTVEEGSGTGQTVGPPRRLQSMSIQLRLSRYTERIATAPAETDWLRSESVTLLTDVQRKALRLFRGDHILTTGLGKGGGTGRSN